MRFSSLDSRFVGKPDITTRSFTVIPVNRDTGWVRSDAGTVPTYIDIDKDD